MRCGVFRIEQKRTHIGGKRIDKLHFALDGPLVGYFFEVRVDQLSIVVSMVDGAGDEKSIGTRDFLKPTDFSGIWQVVMFLISHDKSF